MKALISGVSGFVGSHLAELLIHKKYEVYGIKRFRSDLSNVEHIKDLHLVEGDILDLTSLEGILQDIKPDEIYHLAANSYVPDSWKQPVHTIRTNTIGTTHMLEAMRKASPHAKLLIAGTSEEYGIVHPEECPITESQPLRPLSPYGVSKVAGEMIGAQYHRSYGLHIILTRGYNQSGPRRHPLFATSNFAKQIVDVERGRATSIRVGNIEAIRDFTDVRDMVRAYVLAMESCTPGEPYNICSGTGYKMKDILNQLIGFSGISIPTEHDSSRLRPSDVPRLIGDHSKFSKATGWKPVIPITRTLIDLLEWHRTKDGMKGKKS